MLFRSVEDNGRFDAVDLFPRREFLDDDSVKMRGVAGDQFDNRIEPSGDHPSRTNLCDLKDVMDEGIEVRFLVFRHLNKKKCLQELTLQIMILL